MPTIIGLIGAPKLTILEFWALVRRRVHGVT